MDGNTIKNAFFNLIKTAATLLFPIITFAYVSRIFHAEGMGKINFAKSVVSIFSMCAMLGIHNYGVREIAGVKEDRKKRSCTFKEILYINLVSCAVSYLLLFAMLFWNSKFRGYSGIILIYSINIVTLVLGVEWLYCAMEDYKYIAVRTCAIQIISLIVLLLFVHEERHIYLYALIQVISAGGAYIFNFFHARKYVDLKGEKELHIRYHIKPVLYIFITSVFVKVFTDMDTVMLGLMSDDRVVGLYAAAYKMSTVLSSVIGAATAVTLPRIAYLIENSTKEQVQGLLKKSLHFIFMIGVPVALGAFLFSKTFLTILNGSDFIEADISAKILAIRTFISPLNGVLLINYLTPKKKDKECIMITSIAAVFNLFSNYILIPILQQNGASLATIIAEGIEFVLIIVVVSKSISVKYLFQGIWKYLLASLCMVMMVILICQLINNMIVQLGISVMVGIFVYFGLLYLLKCDLVLLISQKIIKRYFI